MGQVDAVRASLLRRVSRVAVINCLEVPWRFIGTISPAFAQAPAS
ncbi:hypothetical protein [Cyanobium sp. BA5m-21]|nr:hypothetical protein [Cyanobium sp. BA5m-21]